jgi:FAD synthetase
MNLDDAIAESHRIIREALARYPAHQELAFAFNGGKDSCVVLDLLRVVIGTTQSITIVHFVNADEFTLITDFVEREEKEIQFVYADTLRGGVEYLLRAEPTVRAFITGRRSTDPHAEPQPFAPSTAGWPECMRVSPILHWTYHHVWEYLRTRHVPYPALYNWGYTSIGTTKNTRPNPALFDKATGTFRPAYELEDASQERLSRVE